MGGSKGPIVEVLPLPFEADLGTMNRLCAHLSSVGSESQGAPKVCLSKVSGSITDGGIQPVPSHEQVHLRLRER